MRMTPNGRELGEAEVREALLAAGRLCSAATRLCNLEYLAGGSALHDDLAEPIRRLHRALTDIGIRVKPEEIDDGDGNGN